MKRFICILLAALFVASCGIPKGMKVSFVGIERLTPSGLYHFDVDTRFNVDNPSFNFEVRNARGEIRCEDASVMSFSAGDFVVPKGSDNLVPVSFSCGLAESYNYFNVINILRNSDLDKFRVDVNATIYPAGAKSGRTVVYKNIPASRFLK